MKKSIWERLELFATVLLVLCAILSSAAFIKKSYGTSGEERWSPTATRLENWREIEKIGRRFGPDSARTTVATFSDFECPACRTFEATLRAERIADSEDLAAVFIHAPSASHSQAMDAAKTAECAEAQGAFERYHDVLFANQAVLGTRPWSSFAKEAGVPDIAKFELCASDTTIAPRILKGLAMGRSIAIVATPTVVVNGWRLNWVPTARQLRRVVELDRQGRDLAKVDLSKVLEDR